VPQRVGTVVASGWGRVVSQGATGGHFAGGETPLTPAARRGWGGRARALAAGARAAVVANHYAEGGAGALEAADAVWDMACRDELPELQHLYDLDASLTDKIETIARRMYGADGVDVLPEAAEGLRHYEALGYGGLPVCMAKTHLSFTADPHVKGRPTGFTLPVREVRLAAGAGFVVALCGAISRMPGLPAHPAGEAVDIDDAGNVTGLS